MSARRRSVRGWLIVGVLACAQGINQADKAVLGLAAEPIMRELGLSPSQYGLIAGSMFATFALGGMAVAFLAAPRFAPRNIVTAMLIVWSLAQLPVVVAASLPVLVVSRMILGAGEGGGTPTLLNMCHEWFTEDRRALPGAIILAGGAVGALIAAPALTALIEGHGWRSAFVACGAAGIATAAIWLIVARDGPHSARVPTTVAGPGDGTTLGTLLRQPAVVRSLAVGFCAFWVVGFTVGWLAPFVRHLDGVTAASSGWLLSLIYFSQGVIMLAVAAVSERLSARGHGARIAREGLSAGCMVGSAACFAAIAFTEATTARLMLLALATGLPNAVFPLMATTLSGVIPPRERYRVVTIVMSAVTIAALFSPPVVGALIDLQRPDGWRTALLVMAAVCAIGAAAAIGERGKISRG